MMAQELVTAIQEGCKLIVILVDNEGFASIGSLSDSLGSGGFGTRYRFRDESGALEGGPLPTDLAANAASLGAVVHRAGSIDEVHEALKVARDDDRTSVVHVQTDPGAPTPSSGVWWDVPVAEVSDMPSVRRVRSDYESHRRTVRHYL
jgi:3D-(3,5/4)-trihydroxycyclohexane-1,2-dione acylhydrolase (decyclizing)